MTNNTNAQRIADIFERAQYRWDSAGTACAFAFDGESHEIGSLVEGDQITRIELRPAPMYDGMQEGRIVVDGLVDGVRVRDSLAMDANIAPWETVWWIGGYAFIADELDEHAYESQRYANARATVLADLKMHPDAFEPDMSEREILEAGLDCYGSGEDMLDHFPGDPYPAIYRYFAANYPSGQDDIALEGDEVAPAPVALTVDAERARALLERFDAAQVHLAEATNEDGEVDFNSRAWERYDDATSGMAGEFAALIREGLGK